MNSSISSDTQSAQLPENDGVQAEEAMESEEIKCKSKSTLVIIFKHKSNLHL